MANGFTLDELSSALGAYHRTHDMEILRKRVYNPLDREPGAPTTIWDTMRKRFIKDQQGFSRTKLNMQARVAKPTVATQSDDAIIVEGALRKVFDAETILNINPYMLRNTWLDHVDEERFKNGGSPEFSDIEFVPWLGEYLMQEWFSKLVTISGIQGQFNTAATYAADGTANQSWLGLMDGLLKQLADESQNGSTDSTVVATGAITAANAYEKLEAMGKAIPMHLEYSDLFLYCSRQIHDWYNDRRAIDYPGDNARLHPTYKQYTLRNRPNIVIVPIPELKTSQRVWITPNQNMSWNQDIRDSAPQLTAVPISVKEIQIMISHSTGFNFDQWTDVVMNDQDGLVYTPS